MDLDLFGVTEAVMLKVRMAIAVVLLLALAGFIIWYGEWRATSAREATQARYELAIDGLKREASTRLQAETDKVLKTERVLRAAQTEIEEMGHARQEASAEFGRLLAAAVADGGRLRDPNAGRGCSGGGTAGPAAPGTGTGAQDGAQTGGLLSAQLTGLLLRLEREADAINDAYAVCRPDAMTLRSQLSPP